MKKIIDIRKTEVKLNYQNKNLTRKCDHCGFVTNKNIRFCPNCREKDILILLRPMINE